MDSTIFIIASYSVMIGASLLGIISTVAETILIICDKKLRNSPFGIALLSLGISDVLVSVFFLIFGIFAFYLNTLPSPLITSDNTLAINMLIFFSISLTFSFVASFTHVVFIALQRLIAVTFPLQAKRIITNYRCRLITTLLWIFSVLIAAVDLFQFGKVFSYIATVAGIAVVVIYTFICYKVKQSSFINHQDQDSDRQTENRVLVNSLAVTVIFIVCFLPCSLSMIISRNSRSSIVFDILLSMNPFLDSMVYFMSRYYSRRATASRRFQEERPSLNSPNEVDDAANVTQVIVRLSEIECNSSGNIASGN